MRRSRPATLAATIGALMMAAGLTPAAGANGNGNPPDHAVERHAAARTKAEQARVIDYWTTARMRGAVPRGATINPKAKGGKPGGGAGSAKAVQVPADSREGKVFFTLGGTNYVCSGTATTSSNADVVTTAGHCLNEGPRCLRHQLCLRAGIRERRSPLWHLGRRDAAHHHPMGQQR